MCVVRAAPQGAKNNGLPGALLLLFGQSRPRLLEQRLRAADGKPLVDLARVAARRRLEQLCRRLHAGDEALVLLDAHRDEAHAPVQWQRPR
eukprot:1389476-Prymnesium_polylepis.1